MLQVTVFDTVHFIQYKQKTTLYQCINQEIFQFLKFYSFPRVKERYAFFYCLFRKFYCFLFLRESLLVSFQPKFSETRMAAMWKASIMLLQNIFTI